MQQAEDRAHRPGAPHKSVNVHYLIAEVSGVDDTHQQRTSPSLSHRMFVCLGLAAHPSIAQGTVDGLIKRILDRKVLDGQVCTHTTNNTSHTEMPKAPPH